MNEEFECNPRAISGIKWAKDWKARREQSLKICSAFYGTKNFKIFLLGEGNSQEKMVVYFEGGYGPQNKNSQKIYVNGGYHEFDMKTCEIVGGAPTHDPYSYFYKRPLDSYNSIISYQNEYYIVDLFDLNESGREHEPAYYLETWALNNDKSHGCAYSTISPNE